MKQYFHDFAEHYTDLIGHEAQFANQTFIMVGMQKNYYYYRGLWIEATPLITLVNERGELKRYDFDDFLTDQTQKTFEPIRILVSGMYIFLQTKPYKISSKWRQKRQGWNLKHQEDSSSKWKNKDRYSSPRGYGLQTVCNKTKAYFDYSPVGLFVHPSSKFYKGLE